MQSPAVSTRRRFFCKAGVALSAPLAAGTALADTAGDESRQLRLVELESIAAIQELQRMLARRINAGETLADESFAGVVQLEPADFGERDTIELSADGHAASARLHCRVELEQSVEGAGSLATMARAQGNALARLSARRVLVTDWRKQDESWEITRAALVAA